MVDAAVRALKGLGAKPCSISAGLLGGEYAGGGPSGLSAGSGDGVTHPGVHARFPLRLRYRGHDLGGNSPSGTLSCSLILRWGRRRYLAGRGLGLRLG